MMKYRIQINDECGFPWRTRRLTCESDTPEGALDWVERYVNEHVDPDAYEIHDLSMLKVFMNIQDEKGERFKRRVSVPLTRPEDFTGPPWD